MALVALDANLEVEGLPQSATGQASLFTGRNAARLLGRHQTAFPGPRLRALVEEDNLMKGAADAGLAVTFANAYTEEYLAALASGRRRASVTTVMTRSAGVAWRMVDDLVAGEAVTWDLCRDLIGRRVGMELDPIDAWTAGGHLAAIAAGQDLTVYETFVTDLAGHLKRGIAPEEAVRRVDRMIGGLEAARPEDLTWVLTSDHGNLEDVSTGTHTRNPVPLLAVGPAAAGFGQASSILDVTPLVLRGLGVST